MLASKYSRQTNKDVDVELISAMFEKWQELEAENRKLLEELRAMKEVSRNKEVIAKTQLIKMLETVKIQDREGCVNALLEMR